MPFPRFHTFRPSFLPSFLPSFFPSFFLSFLPSSLQVSFPASLWLFAAMYDSLIAGPHRNQERHLSSRRSFNYSQLVGRDASVERDSFHSRCFSISKVIVSINYSLVAFNLICFSVCLEFAFCI